MCEAGSELWDEDEEEEPDWRNTAFSYDVKNKGRLKMMLKIYFLCLKMSPEGEI